MKHRAITVTKCTNNEYRNIAVRCMKCKTGTTVVCNKRMNVMTNKEDQTGLEKTTTEDIVTSAPHYHIHFFTGDNNTEEHHVGRLFLEI